MDHALLLPWTLIKYIYIDRVDWDLPPVTFDLIWFDIYIEKFK